MSMFTLLHAAACKAACHSEPVALAEMRAVLATLYSVRQEEQMSRCIDATKLRFQQCLRRDRPTGALQSATDLPVKAVHFLSDSWGTRKLRWTMGADEAEV